MNCEDQEYKLLFYCKDDQIIEVNYDFVKLTGFSVGEILGKSLSDISKLIRIDTQINLKDMKESGKYYIFTKTYEVFELDIQYEEYEFNEKKFMYQKNACPCLKDKFEFANQLYMDNKTGIIICSFPDTIILKVNDNFLHLFDDPYNKIENCIGINENDMIMDGYKNELKGLWNAIIETKKPIYMEEVPYQSYKRGITYWNISIVPIFVDDRLKYVTEIILDVTDKVLDRKLMVEQKEKLEAIIEYMPDGLYIVDKELNISILNDNMIDFFYSRECIHNLHDVLIDSDYYDLEGNSLNKIEDFPIDKVFAGEKVKEFRVTVWNPKHRSHLSLSGSPLYRKDGKVEKILISARDITENYNKDELIRIQKDQLEAIINNITDEIILVNKKGEYLNINKSSQRGNIFDFIHYISSSDEKKVEMTGILSDLDEELHKKAINGEKFTGYSLNLKENKKTKYREISASPIFSSSGDFIVSILISRDISVRMKAEENKLIKAQYESLSNIIDNLELGFVRFSYPSFCIIDMNYSAFEAFARNNDELVSLIQVKGKEISKISKLKDTAKLMQIIDNRMKSKDGMFMYIMEIEDDNYVQTVFQPIYDLNNEVVEIVLVAVDISDEVRAKNKMEDALTMQKELFANISHELKTPLSIISSANQLIEFFFENNLIEEKRDKVEDKIRMIKDSSNRMKKLVNNILDLSKIESGFEKLKPSNTNIVTVVEDMVQSIPEFMKGKKINIIFDTNTEEKILAIDVDKIERAILNLISNAIKFSDSDSEIYVTVLDQGDYVEVSVKDNGIGIDPAYLDLIFERFHQVDRSFTRNAEGSGIGLSLVKSIIEKHGGTIRVESEIGKGSTFTIKLPVNLIKDTDSKQTNIQFYNISDLINIELSDIY